MERRRAIEAEAHAFVRRSEEEATARDVRVALGHAIRGEQLDRRASPFSAREQDRITHVRAPRSLELGEIIRDRAELRANIAPAGIDRERAIERDARLLVELQHLLARLQRARPSLLPLLLIERVERGVRLFSRDLRELPLRARLAE